jgi:hypothetical protein
MSVQLKSNQTKILQNIGGGRKKNDPYHIFQQQANIQTAHNNLLQQT